MKKPQDITVLVVDDEKDLCEIIAFDIGSAGYQTIAVYSGDAAFASSNGSTVQRIEAAGLIATKTVVASSRNPSLVGQPVTFTATVTRIPGSTPPLGGFVTFLDGTTELGGGTVDATGHAVFTTSALSAGPHTINAAYSGTNGDDLPSNGSTVQTVNTETGKAPSVVNLQRFGFHAQPTVLVLTFNRPLNPATAQDAGNYRITDSGGHPIGLLSASYNPVAQTVTLFPSHRLNIHRHYHLTVIGTGPTGVKGADGRLLDGSGTGHPGTNYEAVIDRATLVVPRTSARLSVHPHGPLTAMRAAPSVRLNHN